MDEITQKKNSTFTLMIIYVSEKLAGGWWF